MDNVAKWEQLNQKYISKLLCWFRIRAKLACRQITFQIMSAKPRLNVVR